VKARERPSPGSVARRFERDGWEILVGKGAADNDVLTFQVADRDDFWLHVAGWSGSHVIVRARGELEPPPAVLEYAATLAAWHSKARGAGGKVEVHLTRAGDVRKRRGAPAGEVTLSQWTPLRVYAREPA
jgi:predicted ribosome quality control (RQC) complex YloA/Tae2 family protein